MASQDHATTDAATPDGAATERPLRLCGMCKTWVSRPCGEGCYHCPSDPTYEEHCARQTGHQSMVAEAVEAIRQSELRTLERVEARLAEATNALRFYAEPTNWTDLIARHAGRDSHYHSAPAHLDKGDRARAALAKADGGAA